MKGRPATDHALDIEVGTLALATQGAVAPVMILLDVEAAFPCLSHSFIMRCIRQFGGKHPAAQVTIEMYTSAATTLLVNGDEFDGFEITGRVCQGCLLSARFSFCVATPCCVKSMSRYQQTICG